MKQNPYNKLFNIRMMLILYIIASVLAACSSPKTQSPTISKTLEPTIESILSSDALGTTETPVPPLVATPLAPGYPLTGIEINNYDDIEPAAKTGAYWIRRNALIWSVVEPSKGNRDWGAVSRLDQELESISSYGMHTILIVRGTPAWAQKLPGTSCGPMSADQIDAFVQFLHDAVVRYSQPPFNVKYWELWNEPDVDPALVAPSAPFGCWGDPAASDYGGGYYAQMLKAAYPAIKSADPEAQVLVGGLLLVCNPDNPPEMKDQPGVKTDCSPAKFFEGVLKGGGGDFFDGVSFHAYDYYFNVLGKYGNGGWYSSWKSTGPVLVEKALYLKNLLNKYGYSGKFLMNTESAVLCGSSGNEPICFQDDWTRTKAYHLVQTFTTAATLGLRANIWYSLKGWRGSGLVDQDGLPTSAYQALVFNNQELRDATPWGEVTLYPGVKGFAFQRDSKLLWVLWSLDGQDHSIPLGSIPSAVYDIFGKSLTPDENFTITLSPIYIEW